MAAGVAPAVGAHLVSPMRKHATCSVFRPAHAGRTPYRSCRAMNRFTRSFLFLFRGCPPSVEIARQLRRSSYDNLA